MCAVSGKGCAPPEEVTRSQKKRAEPSTILRTTKVVHPTKTYTYKTTLRVIRRLWGGGGTRGTPQCLSQQYHTSIASASHLHHIKSASQHFTHNSITSISHRIIKQCNNNITRISHHTSTYQLNISQQNHIDITSV